MKSKILAILSIAITFTLAACNSSDEGEAPKGEQSIMIQLPETAVFTRGVEDAQNPGSTEIEDVNVFLMIGQTLNKAMTFQKTDFNSSGYKLIEDVSAMIDNVIVVINKRDADFTGKGTATLIRNYPFTIAGQNATTGLAGRSHLGGANTVDGGTHPTEPSKTYKKAEVTLDAVTSRVEVGTVVAGEGIENIKLEAVFMNAFYTDGAKGTVNTYPSTATVWDTTPATSIGSTTPLVFSAVEGYPATPVDFSAYQTMSDAAVTTVGDKCYAYHLFHGNIPHLILLVSGSYTDEYTADGKKHFLAWLTYTKYTKSGGGQVSALESNKIYKMGVDGGIVVNAKDLTDKPELKGYDLGLTINVTPWTVEEVTPEI